MLSIILINENTSENLNTVYKNGNVVFPVDGLFEDAVYHDVIGRFVRLSQDPLSRGRATTGWCLSGHLAAHMASCCFSQSQWLRLSAIISTSLIAFCRA